MINKLKCFFGLHDITSFKSEGTKLVKKTLAPTISSYSYCVVSMHDESEPIKKQILHMEVDLLFCKRCNKGPWFKIIKKEFNDND